MPNAVNDHPGKMERKRLLFLPPKMKRDEAKGQIESEILFRYPRTPTECEIEFSRTKKLVTSMRSLLKVGIIKATEYLKAWWDCGIISQ